MAATEQRLNLCVCPLCVCPQGGCEHTTQCIRLVHTNILRIAPQRQIIQHNLCSPNIFWNRTKGSALNEELCEEISEVNFAVFVYRTASEGFLLIHQKKNAVTLCKLTSKWVGQSKKLSLAL